MFRNNIIAQAEFRHQRYVIENSRSGRTWIALAVLMLLPALLVSLALLISVILNLGWGKYFVDPEGSLIGILVQVSSISMITMNIALYLVVILVTLGLSYNSIAREHTNRTWDVLLLTNVNAPTLIMGKWWGSLRSMGGDHFMLVILRIGLIAQFIDTGDLTISFPGRLLMMVMFCLLAYSFTVIDAALTVALGVASAVSPYGRSSTIVVVLGVRFIGVLAGIVGIYTLPFAILSRWEFGVLAVVFLLSFMLVTGLVLWVGQWIAVKGQVSAT